MNDTGNTLYYSDYLRLDTLLEAQHPESQKHGVSAHDETLFIITHQAYELWFKQILHELHSILVLFSSVPLDEKKLNTMLARLERISRIQRLINQQIGILETMTPLDFLDFRDYLTPASGFQSVQFREIEFRLGLSHHLQRKLFGRFSGKDRAHLTRVIEDKSLFEYLECWLVRTPFLNCRDFNFWQSYRDAVKTMLNHDADTIANNSILSDTEKSGQLKGLKEIRNSFNVLFDEDLYQQNQSQGRFKLSHSATLAALFIQLYRDEPMLQQPFKLLTRLMDIDEQLTAWRSGHVMMVQRMIGMKIGTGGSSGCDYLKSTISDKRIFADLFNLSTFLIPRSQLPSLPVELQRNLAHSTSNSENLTTTV